MGLLRLLVCMSVLACSVLIGIYGTQSTYFNRNPGNDFYYLYQNGNLYKMTRSSRSPEPQTGFGFGTSYGPPAYTPTEPLGVSATSLVSSSGVSTQSCPPNDPGRNKQIVHNVFRDILGLHKLDDLENYFHQEYIQHNPEVADGRDALRDYVKMDNSPAEPITPLRSAADGDLVWTHNRLNFDGKYFAVVDIFRFECGKIREHWDVIQDTQLTEPARNSHPFF